MKRRYIVAGLFGGISSVIISLCVYFEINPFKDHSQYAPWQSSYVEQLEIGDIVFRTAYGKESRLIQLVSGGDYSHIAVITELLPNIVVTHATTNEHPEKQNQVISTPIIEFLSPTYAKTYLIARPDFLTSLEKRRFAAMIAQKIGEPYLLRNRTLNNLYCTTLLEAPLRSLIPDLTLQWQDLEIPGMTGDYLFPDAFLALGGLRHLLKDDVWLHSQ